MASIKMPASASIEPHVSVVMPTCNRPDDVRRCLDSLTHVVYSHWDILVVDQGDDARARDVVDAYTDRLPRLIYYHTPQKGAARARNAGLHATRGDIVAFIDDDCTVESDWLEHVSGAFARHPYAALVIGTVTSAPHDPFSCFIPIHEVLHERVMRGRKALVSAGGMSASFYVCRRVARHVGLFDPELGPGTSIFQAGGEDSDLIYRMLALGYTVVETPAIVVRHHGGRDYASGAASRLIRRSFYVWGAVDMKLLRCGDFAAITVIAAHLWERLAHVSLRNLFLRRGPTGLSWIALYAWGLCASFRLGVDRRRRLYVAGPKKR